MAPMFLSPRDPPPGFLLLCLMSRRAGWPAVKVIVLVVWSWPCAVTARAAPPISAADAAMAIVVRLMLVLLVGRGTRRRYGRRRALSSAARAILRRPRG